MGLLLVITVLILSLAGCLSPVELDANGYVVLIGADRGVNKKYYFTLALQRELAEQNTESEGGAIALACEGDSIFEAVNELEGNVPYTLNFSRTNFIVISRELAEEGALRELVTTSFDSLRVRTSAVVLVTDGEVSEFVGGMYANNDANISKLQSALMLDEEKTGMVSVMSVSRLLEANAEGRFDYCTALGSYDDGIITDMEQKKTESEGKNPLGYVEKGDRVGGLKSLVSGTALFSGWSMTGELTREETVFLNMAVGDFKSGVITLEYRDGSTVSVLLSMGSVKREVDFGAEGVKAKLRVRLYAAAHLADEDISPRDMDEWLTGDLARFLEGRLYEVFEKCRSAGSDAMRLGTELSKRFGSAEELEKFGWREAYRGMSAEFIVETVNVDKYVSERMQ